MARTAHAYAAAGWFDCAVQTAKDALALASEAQANDLTPDIRQRLKLYRHEKPFRAPRSRPDDPGEKPTRTHALEETSK